MCVEREAGDWVPWSEAGGLGSRPLGLRRRPEGLASGSEGGGLGPGPLRLREECWSLDSEKGGGAERK